MRKYIVRLQGKSAVGEPLVGGKAASIAWLQKHRFPVPKGFIVNVHAFHDFLDEFGIQVLREQQSWSQSDLLHIREMLVACRMPDRIADEIVSAYTRLGGPVAVRSSMVGEDTTVSTFAGQLDTYLNVTGAKAVLEAVRRCWASIFNWRLSTYLAMRNTRLSQALIADFSIAVVVQRMIDAKAAGVAFSADPITGEGCVLVEAVHGLGASLVRGTAESDRYIVDARRTVCTVQSIAPDRPVLQEAQILALADLVSQVAAKADEPKDVEWAWDGKRMYLLQSRPITSLVGKRVYSNRMVSEMLPGLIKPLVWSISTQSKLNNVLGRIFSELIGPNDIDFSRLAKRIHSRIYADNTMLGELLKTMGMPANFFEVMSRGERAATHRMPPLNWRTLRTMARLARFVWRHARIADEITAYIAHHQQELDAYRRSDYMSERPETLLSHVDCVAELYTETMWYNFVGPMNMMVRNHLLQAVVRRLVPSVPPEDVVRGLVGLKSLDSSRELELIAWKAIELGEETCILLTDGSDHEIRMALSGCEQGQLLLAKVGAFLEQYGFLSAVGTDPSRTSWFENPTVIWQAIGRAALNPRTTESKNVQAIRAEARDRINASLSVVQRFVFNRLLESTMTYMDLREQSSAVLSEESFELRRIFLAIADQWVAAGILDNREDVFYLTLDEVRGIALGDTESAVARANVTRRREEMEADAQIELPDLFCGDTAPAYPIVLPEQNRRLDGISGSAGWAEGCARIILDPAEAPPRLSERDILVVPFSDISWTPLFACVGGVVAETGGQLSHSAIVAREYGLPAVVNVKNATRLIQDGQLIIVDGNRGQVHIG
jgi:phosphohistidine swiveling domain-containing protein